jgi:peroxiredoxin
MKQLYFLLAFVAILISSTGMAQPAGGYKVGDKATDFSLKNVDGNTVSMAGNPEARGYIVVFTCNTCPFAQAYESRIIALHKKYAPQGYSVIAINPNDPVSSPGDSYEKMQERANQKKYPFPYLVDETQQVARTYGATRTPHVFILKKQNDDFVVQYIGTIDDNSQDASDVDQKFVENAMAQVITGKPVANSVTKAIGCAIKWKNS